MAKFYSSKRFMMLCILAIAQIQTIGGMRCFVAIVDKLEYAYKDITSFDINYLVWSFNIAYLPVSPVATYWIEKYGIRKALLFGVGI